MTRRADNLRYEVRSLAKELVWYLTNTHRPGAKRDIGLFATRRGGSTWLMEIIAANPGVKSLDQPFSTLSRTVTPSAFRRLPRFEEGEVVHLTAEQETRFRSFVDLLLSGDLPVNAPTKPWKRDFHFRTDRLLLKIVEAKALIDWFDRTYGLHIVFLTRHPIPQALSCIRNGWTLTVAPYLHNPCFVEQHLGDGLLGYSHDLLRRGSPLERFVLNWALENLVPLRLAPERPRWLQLGYEDCVLEPERTIEAVADALDLADLPAMLRKVRQPSRSSAITTAETRSLIAAGDPEAIVGKWRRDVSDDDERAAFAVLDRFGIDRYRPGRVTPSPS